MTTSGGGQEERSRYWRGLIAEHSSSGLSIQAFCSRRRVSTVSFYNWRRRLKSAGDNGGRTRSKQHGQLDPCFNFVAIDLPARPPHCEVILNDGRRVLVPAHFDGDSLRVLFAALSESP